MNFDIGWGDDWAAEADFLNGQGLGQTEKGTEIVSIDNVVEDENYGMLFEGLMEGGGGLGFGGA